MIQSFLCAFCLRVSASVCARGSQSRSRKPLGGLSRETAEIEVGNSHQKRPNQERCRQEPPCKGTEGNRGVGGMCVCACVVVRWFSWKKDGSNV